MHLTKVGDLLFETKTRFVFHASATLQVGLATGSVKLEFLSEDGLMPTYGECSGDPELLEMALYAEQVIIRMFDRPVLVDVFHINKTTGALCIPSAPIFAALRQLAERSAP